VSFVIRKKKDKEKKEKKSFKIRLSKFTFLIIILDIIMIDGLVLIHNEEFKAFWIPTAMTTMSHKYLAYTLYDEETVNRVMSENYIEQYSETMSLDDIVIGDFNEKKHYTNKYEQELFTKDPGNDVYKTIRIIEPRFKGWLIAIYDPSKVHILTGKKFNTSNKSGKETVLQMTKRLNAVVGINGGGFVDYGYGSDIPIGYVIKDGKVIWSPTDKQTDLIGFTKDNKLLLVHATGEEAVEMGMRDALQFGPFLMINGERPDFKNSAGGFSRAARVAIAQRKDGIVLFLVTEGTHAAGPNMKEVIDTLELYGAYNAANLDGGTSTQLVINGKLVNHPKNITGQAVTGGRGIVTGWGLILDE
jgi:exopolysaccharide biosynthesis protein